MVDWEDEHIAARGLCGLDKELAAESCSQINCSCCCSYPANPDNPPILSFSSDASLTTPLSILRIDG